MLYTKKQAQRAKALFVPDSARAVRAPSFGGARIHGSIVDTDTHYIQERYLEISNMSRTQATLWAWKGDKASSALVLLSKEQPLRGVTVTCSELRCGVHVIPASCVEISFLREVDAFVGHAGWYAMNPGGRMPWGPKAKTPDVVWNGEPLDLPANRLQPVWLEFQIPRDAAAGRYTATVTAGGQDGMDRLTFTYTVDVLNALLPVPEEYSFTVEYWQHPYNIAEYYGVEPFSQQHCSILKRHLERYKALGGRVTAASIVEEAWGGQTYSKNKVRYPSMIRWIREPDGSFSYDYTQFDAWVEVCRSVGLGQQVVCYSMLPWNNIVAYFDRASGRMGRCRVKSQDSHSYQGIWLPFLRDFVAHLDEKSWFSSVSMGFDERKNMDIAFDTIDMVKNKEGGILKKSAAFNDFLHNRAIFNRLDFASVGLDEVRAQTQEFQLLVNERANSPAGQKTTIYTATEHYPNSFALSMPCESYWSVFYAGKYHADGFLRWALDAWVEDPLRDATHWSFQAGDCFLLYPDERESRLPVSHDSVRLKKLDEAVRDLNKLRAIAQDCPALAPQVEQLLAGVKERYSSVTQRNRFWGLAIRTAVWADQRARKELPEDMRLLKKQIRALSERYAAVRENGGPNRTD